MDETRAKDLIVIRQLPEIEEQLRTVKEEIERKTSIAVSLVCTEETLAEVKRARAELNKEFLGIDERRKQIKKTVMEPLDCFEKTFHECVAEPFKIADESLKQKIADVENNIKSRCEESLRDYFSELCDAEHLEWLRFEQSGIKIDLTSAKAKTPAKLRAQLADFVQRVSLETIGIYKMDDADEIMAEYKRTLNASQAILTVQERRRSVEQERAERETACNAIERENAAMRRVEALAPPVDVKEEPPLRCTFTVVTTREKLRKLKEFLIAEGINYE